ncbi:DUF2116 family Zn-ribbon domain-containing protein [Cedecea neteri]|uniref:DUF2116 family Zn-ribbon domain-containing protein n=1 Tax=Cedecea neteri TaxID=158822 RepID=UPI0039173EFC
MSSLLKPCPDCGKLICPDATLCDYCNSKNPFERARRRDRIRNVVAVIVISAFLIALVLWFSWGIW